MSIQQITIRCDWPGCQADQTLSYYPGSLKDHQWAFVNDWRFFPRGQHLCPEHRHRTRRELDEALKAAQAREDL